VVDLFKGDGVDAVVAMLTLFAHRDETGLAQHLEVLRHGGLADGELSDELRDARAAFGFLVATLQHPQDLAPGSIGYHVEDVGHNAQRMPWQRYAARRGRVGDTMFAVRLRRGKADGRCPAA